MALDHLVPTVDVARGSADDLAGVDRACRDHGFFLLSGHGLDGLIVETWERTREFFAADQSVKQSIVRDDANPFGYFDRELTKRKRDNKEVFDFGDPAHPRADGHNRWPAEPDAFHDTMARFYDAMSKLARTTTSIVHRALGLDPTLLDRFHGDRATSSVRLNHYPIGDLVPESERDALPELGETALGYHTDPGVLTLLLQDNTGGLQALASDDTWVDIEPQPGTIVVNLGDAMQVWSNDHYRAAVHRVVPMTQQDRYSIPYFLNPVRGAVIEPIEALTETPKYSAFEWSDYMRSRTQDNFADIGAADAQITDYLIAVD